MPDSALADVRRTLAAITESIASLPEVRPSQLPAPVVEAIGDLIHACDGLSTAMAGDTTEDAAVILASVRAYRRLLWLTLAEAMPEQAGFWTDDYIQAERAAEARAAAGLIPRFYRDPDFEARVRAQWLGEDKA